MIDGKLNGICGTYVEEKEKFKEWRNMRTFGVKIDRDIMVNVLWTRLLCVYQQRITLRGWTGGNAYKTLKEENQELLRLQGVTPLETNTYLVLEDGNSLLDVSFSNAIRSCILVSCTCMYIIFFMECIYNVCLCVCVYWKILQAYGGKVVNEVTPETIVICSFDDKLNGRMFANVRNCKHLIDRMSFIESLRKMNRSEIETNHQEVESLITMTKPEEVSSNATIAEFILKNETNGNGGIYEHFFCFVYASM